ncbi:hypothetical protein sync_1621 [Synechococcus sp. CC9311]|nr:hypothetical protein sync_1621 [Synechococcus sp. CC9311]
MIATSSTPSLSSFSQQSDPIHDIQADNPSICSWVEQSMCCRELAGPVHLETV